MDGHEIEENAGVWEEAAFLSNTFIFVLAGLIIADRIFENTTFNERHLMRLLATTWPPLYCCISSAR